MDNASEFLKEIQNSVFGRLSEEVQVFKSLNVRIDEWRAMPGADALEIIRKSLMRSIALGMCRLCDPAQSRSSITKSMRENLTLKALEIRLTVEGKCLCAKKISCFLSNNADLIEEMKHLRNWYLAHVDAQAYVGNDPIPQIPHEDILYLFDDLDLLLNQLSSSLDRSFTNHGIRAMSGGDGDVLLNTLKAGRAYQILRAEMLNEQSGLDQLRSRIENDHMEIYKAGND